MSRLAVYVMVMMWATVLRGETLFIDVDTIPTDIAFTANPYVLQATVVRLAESGKKTPSAESLATNAGVAGVLRTLLKFGNVNVLYHAEREAASDGTMVYDALERRPAFLLVADPKNACTNLTFGLALKIKVLTAAGGNAHLEWQGDFSWSRDLIHHWSTDQVFMLGLAAAKIVKPGVLFVEGGDDDDDAPAQNGINLGGLFHRKKAEPKVAPASVTPIQVSFLNVDFQHVALQGRANLKTGEMTVIRYEPENYQETKEAIYLLMQATRE